MAAPEPWGRSVEERHPTRVTALRHAPPPTGPTTPQPGVEPVRALRLWRLTGPLADLYWVGAHGGAGETTLAAALPGSVATEHRWPSPNPEGPPARAVLVARTSWCGLDAAQAAIRQWHARMAGHCLLLGVVFSADAPGKRPRILTGLQRRIAGGVGHPLELDWVDQWRLPPTDPPAPPPTAVTRLLGEVTAIAYPPPR